VYHGTSAENVDDILKNGIQPRENTNKSNWTDIESISNHVYLTRIYSLYFGMCAVDNLSDENIAIFEVDLNSLDEDLLYPDEDFIEQGIRHSEININPHNSYDKNEDIIQRTKSIRENIRFYDDLWLNSLQSLGNISYNSHIPTNIIRRVAIIDAPPAFLINIDPTITIQNAMVMSDKYKAYTEFVFNKNLSLEDMFIVDNIPMINIHKLTKDDKKELINTPEFKSQISKYKKLVNNIDIEIINLD